MTGFSGINGVVQKLGKVPCHVSDMLKCLAVQLGDLQQLWLKSQKHNEH